ncbi:aldose-1-epimerase, putative [Ricinus communis]|uniref:Aldose 1-epimerase n=1 Tax=Ricinus communis TaxID=3988 RepID=B9RUP1_RICCO|nr:aldose-1-epimerase, putative [Ricinus communis]|eukprot:XP_002517486.1 aldose 1-epimerase [Ricinus communis]
MGKISFLFCFCILVAFGFANGAEEKVEFYELKKGNISMKLTNWGASIVSFVIPDKTGKPIDVVLGYDTIKEYQTDSTYFGAVVGRVANRIGGAEFKLNGKTYKLPANDGKNMLHGGAKGYSDVVWKVTKYKNSGNAPFIVFTHRSSDGEEGFPGALRVVVTYTLLADGQLSVFMKAKGLDDKVSPVSLAQHTYWNLAGHNSGNILEAKVRIFGQFYTAVDENLVPTGQLLYARGTAYDFTEPELKPVGKRIDLLPKGYDINYVLDDFEPNKIRQVAIVEDVKSGVRMELATDAPGLQFYTGNMISNVKGKGGVVYQAHAGLCLETQWYPDFVNHPAFPQSLVQQGKVYKHHMLFNFTTI